VKFSEIAIVSYGLVLLKSFFLKKVKITKSFQFYRDILAKRCLVGDILNREI